MCPTEKLSWSQATALSTGVPWAPWHFSDQFNNCGHQKWELTKDEGVIFSHCIRDLTVNYHLLRMTCIRDQLWKTQCISTTVQSLLVEDLNWDWLCQTLLHWSGFSGNIFILFLQSAQALGTTQPENNLSRNYCSSCQYIDPRLFLLLFNCLNNDCLKRQHQGTASSIPRVFQNQMKERQFSGQFRELAMWQKHTRISWGTWDSTRKLSLHRLHFSRTARNQEHQRQSTKSSVGNRHAAHGQGEVK